MNSSKSPLELSTALLTAVFQEWLNVGSLLKLDSACCSAASRKAYLEVVRSDGFCLGSASYRVINASSMNWFIERKLKVKKVWINEVVSIDAGMATAFLHVNAATMENFWISGCTGTSAPLLAAILGIMSFSVRRLKSLCIDGCDAVDSKALGALLSATAGSLRRLRLSECNVSARLAVPRLPKLEMFYLESCTLETVPLCQLVSSCPNLRAFGCSDLHGRDDCLATLAAHSPHLQELYYENGDSADISSLVRLLLACPNVHVVDISTWKVGGNPSATDAHIAAIMQHCKKLRTLCAPANGTAVSAASVMAVVSRLDDLRHLWLYDCVFESDQPVLAISEHCQNLVSLVLTALASVASQDALVKLVRNLHSVVELCLEEFELSDPVLEAIAAHCPKLQILSLYHCNGYTEVGIAALARSCTTLKTVYSRKDDEFLNPTAMLLWQVLRPGLEFSHQDGVARVWRDMHAVDRDELVVW